MVSKHLTECLDIDILVNPVACDGWVIV